MPKDFNKKDVENLESGINLMVGDQSEDESFIFYGRCSTTSDSEKLHVKVIMGGSCAMATLLFAESFKQDDDILSVIKAALLMHDDSEKDGEE